jgi:hypothetical protein
MCSLTTIVFSYHNCVLILEFVLLPECVLLDVAKQALGPPFERVFLKNVDALTFKKKPSKKKRSTTSDSSKRLAPRLKNGVLKNVVRASKVRVFKGE